MDVINLKEKAAKIDNLHEYRRIAKMNNYNFTLVKAKRILNFFLFIMSVLIVSYERYFPKYHKKIEIPDITKITISHLEETLCKLKNIDLIGLYSINLCDI